jgi:tetratricopeptide (TPR) repeat protein
MSAVAPLAAEPSPLVAIFKRINEHEQRGELDAAEALLKEHFGAGSEHPYAQHLSGIVAWRRGQADEALRLMERSIELDPKAALYPRNLCEIYRLLGRYDRAVSVGERATALAPKDPQAHVNLSMVHYDRRDLDRSLACADAALELDANFAPGHFSRAKALLVCGRFAEGWEEYEWRFRVPEGLKVMPKIDKPLWDGQPLGEERLLLIADQGYGDVIQFGRYVAWARERASNIALAGAPELRPILRQFAADGVVCTRWEDVGEFSCYSSLSGLPRLHGTALENLPVSVPYLQADPARVAHWRQQIGARVPEGYRRIGIAWSGRLKNGDHRRSAALAAFAPLAMLERTVLIAVQKERAAQEIGGYLGWAPLLNLGPGLRDFDDTMAVMESVDLVVSIDTAVGHLGGALGRPVWVALSAASDWRWLLGRDDSPWYPHHRLFWQRTPGDWGPVFEQIALEVERDLPV